MNDYVVVPGNERSIAEFCVMQKYRRQGIGKRVAFNILTNWPDKGDWQ